MPHQAEAHSIPESHKAPGETNAFSVRPMRRRHSRYQAASGTLWLRWGRRAAAVVRRFCVWSAVQELAARAFPPRAA